MIKLMVIFLMQTVIVPVVLLFGVYKLCKDLFKGHFWMEINRPLCGERMKVSFG